LEIVGHIVQAPTSGRGRARYERMIRDLTNCSQCLLARYPAILSTSCKS
jgi:hypothetical protein